MSASLMGWECFAISVEQIYFAGTASSGEVVKTLNADSSGSMPTSTLLALITLVWLSNVLKPPFLHVDIHGSNRMPLLCVLPGHFLASDQSPE